MCGRYYINSNILKKIEQVEAVSGALRYLRQRNSPGVKERYPPF